MYPILFSFSTHFPLYLLIIHPSRIYYPRIIYLKIKFCLFLRGLFCRIFYCIHKKKTHSTFSIIGRGAAGLSFIYFFNFFCAARDIITGIGINPITGAVCTVLGIPGAILLYAIKIYSFL